MPQSIQALHSSPRQAWRPHLLTPSAHPGHSTPSHVHILLGATPRILRFRLVKVSEPSRTVKKGSRHYSRVQEYWGRWADVMVDDGGGKVGTGGVSAREVRRGKNWRLGAKGGVEWNDRLIGLMDELRALEGK